jgi:hypothetical protein
MAKAIVVRGRLADPRHVELEESITALTGEVEVVLRAVSAAGAKAEAPATDRMLMARLLQASAPRQTSDSAELLRHDRKR